jgi:hypothetical protein
MKMRDFVILILLSALVAPPHSVAERLIELNDGGMLLIRTDGNMVHRDPAGHRVRMRDGESMEAMDGLHYAMKNDPAWRQIIQETSKNPNS